MLDNTKLISIINTQHSKEAETVGLDNGICVKRNEYTNNIPELKRFEVDWDKDHKYDFEVAYYRKCWNIRYDLFDLGIGYNEGYYSMTKQDVETMIELLQSYNAENFTDNGTCIWDWDDEEWPYSEKIQRDIENLKILRVLMDKYELEVYFYDSY